MKEMRSLTFPNGETYEIVDEKAREDIDNMGIVESESYDSLDPSEALEIELVESGETRENLFIKFTKAVRNIRWLIKEVTNLKRPWTTYWSGSLDVTKSQKEISLSNDFFNFKDVQIEVVFQGEGYDSCYLPIEKGIGSKHAILRGITTSAGCVLITITDAVIRANGQSNGVNVQLVSVRVR